VPRGALGAPLGAIGGRPGREAARPPRGSQDLRSAEGYSATSQAIEDLNGPRNVVAGLDLTE